MTAKKRITLKKGMFKTGDDIRFKQTEKDELWQGKIKGMLPSKTGFEVELTGLKGTHAAHPKYGQEFILLDRGEGKPAREPAPEEE
jgi:hypothetical protein